MSLCPNLLAFLGNHMSTSHDATRKDGKKPWFTHGIRWNAWGVPGAWESGQLSRENGLLEDFNLTSDSDEYSLGLHDGARASVGYS